MWLQHAVSQDTIANATLILVHLHAPHSYFLPSAMYIAEVAEMEHLEEWMTTIYRRRQAP
jgi:hypothetical protein